MGYRVVAACPVPGGFPPPINVVNWAYQMYRLSIPIWSFYDKTYTVLSYLLVHLISPARPPLARLP